jgi:endonuclease YncB( thermonuclease family)
LGSKISNLIFKSTAKLCVCVVVAAWLFALGCSRTTTTEKPLVTPQNFADAPATQVLTGRIVAVADGDTVRVLDATNTQHRIRLQGIDAPESHQAFGTQSKKSLSEMIFGREVTVTYEKTDQYGRLVGKILLDGRDINMEQVRNGMAWHYKEYQREQTPADRELYAKAEDEARTGRRGLWTDANPTSPSQFRKDRRSEQRSRAAATGMLTPLRALTVYSY